ncbi:hypothetical protein B8T70_14285 [Flavobacterium sp. AJR]|nr:hypothetical protein B8T70_14285 [Flavobacterium sp. AJR]
MSKKLSKVEELVIKVDGVQQEVNVYLIVGLMRFVGQTVTLSVSLLIAQFKINKTKKPYYVK